MLNAGYFHCKNWNKEKLSFICRSWRTAILLCTPKSLSNLNLYLRDVENGLPMSETVRFNGITFIRANKLKEEVYM